MKIVRKMAYVRYNITFPKPLAELIEKEREKKGMRRSQIVVGLCWEAFERRKEI